MSKTKWTWPTRRGATVTLHLSEETYEWLLDLLARSIPYEGAETPETHPLLRQVRENVVYTTLIAFPPKEEAAE